MSTVCPPLYQTPPTQASAIRLAQLVVVMPYQTVEVTSLKWGALFCVVKNCDFRTIAHIKLDQSHPAVPPQDIELTLEVG